MHFAYSDKSKFKATVAELTLVATSVLFLATTFAGSELYTTLGFDPEISEVLLGIAATAAFICAIALVIVDWAGTAALHRDAGERFSALALRFRKTRCDDKTWPHEISDELGEEYEAVSVNTIQIPDRKFNSLKVQYLLKKEVSAFASKNPGVPLIILKLRIQGKAVCTAWKGSKE